LQRDWELAKRSWTPQQSQQRKGAPTQSRKQHRMRFRTTNRLQLMSWNRLQPLQAGWNGQ
jgi:hypothetical protein